MNKTIAERVKAIIVEVLKVDGNNISLSSKIRDDLGADSLDTVSLIMAVEDEFKGSISDEEAMKLQTVGDIIGHIEKMKAEQTV